MAYGNPLVLRNLAEELRRRRLWADVKKVETASALLQEQCLHPARVVLVDMSFPSLERVLEYLYNDPLQPLIYVCPGRGRALSLEGLPATCRVGALNASVGVICDQLEAMLRESETPEEAGRQYARRRVAIDRLLFHSGVTLGSRGGRCLSEALKLGVENMRLLDNLEGRLYPTLALRMGGSAASIERSMRYAIDGMWRRMSAEERRGFQPWNDEKPGNKRFLTALLERLENEEKIFYE